MAFHPTSRSKVVAALALLAASGIALETAVTGVRDWLFDHPLTNGIVVGALLISATYLVVERALEERERRRWAQATGPLLSAIAAAGATADGELRAGVDSTAACAWLGDLLDRYQAILTGTPDLIEHWHAALSLAQRARGGAALGDPAAYEAAWARFCTTFADVHDFATTVPVTGATWAVLPAINRPGTPGGTPA